MSLIKCQECKRKISDTAQFCPHCGYNYRNIPLDQKTGSNKPQQTSKASYKFKNGFFSVWYDVWDALKVVLEVIRNLLFAILIVAGFLFVIFLFFYLIECLTKHSLLWAWIVGLIGLAAFCIVVNIVVYNGCYKSKVRKKWFFGVTLFMSILIYMAFLYMFSREFLI